MIDKIFSFLNDWRRLPAYQLERRADIFFAVHLDKIFEATFNEEILTIIPEFPVRIGTIYPEIDINKSYKIDYAVFTKSNLVYLVELKTDDSSTRKEQYKYYYSTIEVGLERILNGLLMIFDATNSKNKYQNLLNKLIAIEAIYTNNENEYSPTRKFKFSKEPVFIKPNKFEIDTGLVIDFNQITDLLSQENNNITKEFVKALRKWKEPV